MNRLDAAARTRPLDPGGAIFDPDRMRPRLRAPPRNGSCLAVSLADTQILRGDLPAIAGRFYKAYCVARSSPSGVAGSGSARGACGNPIPSCRKSSLETDQLWPHLALGRRNRCPVGGFFAG